MADNSNHVATNPFVWTDDEVGLLLQVILDYKNTKQQDSLDWELCHSKYSDITSAFQAQYPSEPSDKDFPHDGSSITKAQITSQMKHIRGRFRHAVHNPRRSEDRVMLLFYGICDEIWGAATRARNQAAGTEGPPAKLAKQGSLKRKAAADDTVQEDLRIKERMLEVMEESSRRNAEHMERMCTNIANLTTVIQEGFSLMRQLLVPQPFDDPPHVDDPHDIEGVPEERKTG